MSLYDRFGSNPEKEKEGVWVTADETDPLKPVRFKVAYMGVTNKKFLKSAEKRSRGFRKVKTDIETAMMINEGVFIDSCLLGWENVLEKKVNPDDPDKPLAFTHDNAKALFKLLPRLYEFLYNSASDPETFSEDERDMEAEAKN